MKIKYSFILLLLSSSALSYNSQEIVQIINNQIKNSAFVRHDSIPKGLPILNWQALSFPQMNEKFSMVGMKNNNSLMFVYSPYSSNKDIYKSKDTGLHWQKINSPEVNHIHHLISIDENRLLLAGDNKIYLSKDQGEHWTLSTTVDQSCDKLFSPSPNLILLTTNFNYPLSGLYRSIDGGNSFTPARLGINGNYPFFVVGGTENILLAGTEGIFVSTNKGLLWQQPSVNWTDKLLSAVAINHQNEIFLVAKKKLYKTDMTGKMEAILNSNAGSVENLKIDTDDRLYIVLQQEKDFGLYRSTNNQTWQLLHRFNKIIDFNILNNGKVLINTDEGLMLSDDNQLNYTKLSDLPYSNATNGHTVALDDTHFFVTALAYAGPLYASSDAGHTWTIKRNTSVLDVAAFNHQVIVLEYDGNNQQIVLSNDYGSTWQSILQINKNYCHSLSSQHNGLIINCNKDSYFSQDLLNWATLRIKKKNPILSSYFSGKAIYVTDGNTVQHSINNGLNWKYLLDGLNQNHAYIAGYNDDLLIIAINNAGIIKMTNNNQNWGLINDGLTNFNFTNLIVIDANHYLVSTENGIFYTQNGGKDWIPENHGLNNLSILSLSLYQNTLLAGTEGSGIFKTNYFSVN